MREHFNGRREHSRTLAGWCQRHLPTVLFMTSASETHDASRVDPFTAMQALRAALDQAGIVLPSLAVDPQASSSRVRLVHLGRIRPDVAMRLADALQRGAAA